jgi:hypothetical protein
MDTIETKSLPDWGPFQMEARLIYDHDTSHDDVDVFTPKQIEAWKNDEWYYVGLEVTVSFNGIELGSASLWGIEYGWIPLTDEQDNLTEEPVQHYDPLDDTSPGSFIDDVGNEACADAVRNLEQLQKVTVPVSAGYPADVPF